MIPLFDIRIPAPISPNTKISDMFKKQVVKYLESLGNNQSDPLLLVAPSNVSKYSDSEKFCSSVQINMSIIFFSRSYQSHLKMTFLLRKKRREKAFHLQIMSLTSEETNHFSDTQETCSANISVKQLHGKRIHKGEGTKSLRQL